MAKSGMDSLLKGRWTIWALALVFAMIAGFGVLAIIGSAAEKVTYYVAAENIPARTALVGDMIEPRTANADGVPATAVSLAYLQSEPLYTKIALRAGEPLTASNIGPLSRITDGVPDGYVAASLAVAPENAAAGKISRGDYVDIAGVIDDGQAPAAKVVLHNVLVLDVTVAPDTIARAATTTTAVGGVSQSNAGTGPDSAAARNGLPELYTLAVSPEDFVTLAILRNYNPYLALTAGVGLDASEVDAYTTRDQIFGEGAVGNAGAGTEDTIAIQQQADDQTIAQENAPDATSTEVPAADETVEAPAPSATPADAAATPAGTSASIAPTAE